MLLWHYSFHRLSTKQMRAVRGVSTIISRGARSILQIQQYCRLCTIEYVSLLKIAGWRSIYSEWRTLTTSQNSGISTYSVFGRCAERYVKFIYSEKATKVCEISTVLLSYVAPVKSKVEILQNFVAFSECMNFTTSAVLDVTVLMYSNRYNIQGR